MSDKPWYKARWETVEPEEPVYAEKEVCYDEPSLNELIDMEFGYEPSEQIFQDCKGRY